MHPALVPILLPALLAAAPPPPSAPPSPLETAPAAPLEIGRVDIRGLETLEEPLVRLSTSSSPGTTLTTAGLAADVRALLATGLFRTATADWELLPSGRARVLFRLEEAPPLTGVRVIGMTLVDPAPLEALARDLVTGVPTRDMLDRLSQEISARYQEAGYYGCGLSVAMPTEMTTGGELTLRVVEPVLGRVRIEGNRRVRTHDIRRRLRLRPGRVVRLEAMDQSLRALARMGTLHSMRFEPGPVPSGDEGVLDLHLVAEEEHYLGDLELGASYERVNGAAATLALVRRNILSSGATLRVSTDQGQRQSYSARLSSDWIFGLPLSGEVGVHSTETRREARQAGTLVSRLTERRTGQVYRLSKAFGGSMRAALTFRDEDIHARAVDGYTLPANLTAIGGDPLSIGYAQQAVGLVLAHGPESIPLTLEARRAERLEAEYAGGPLFRSPADYTTLKLEARRLVGLGRRTRFAWRARAGAIFLRDGVLPFLEQLTVGGSETLRGLRFKELAGDRMLLANLELRRTLSRKVEGVAFVDWGDSWERQLRGLDGQLAYGLGARVDVKLFQLRLDLAHAVGKEGVLFSFGVGHLF